MASWEARQEQQRRAAWAARPSRCLMGVAVRLAGSRRRKRGRKRQLQQQQRERTAATAVTSLEGAG